MPTAFRYRECEGCLKELYDVHYDGEAKEQAKKLIKKKVRVEIGFYRIDIGWQWEDYCEYLRSKKMRKHYSTFFIL